MTETLRILSIGAGAIGTYIGGSLALSGHEVVFLEKPEAIAVLQSGGIRLRLNDLEQRIEKPKVVNRVEAAMEGHSCEVALFALKSYDTLNFLNSLDLDRYTFPPVLCLSNGVENESLIARFLGEDKVIAGTVTSAIGRRSVGDILLERKRGVGIAAGHPLSKKLVTAFDKAGLNAHLFQNAGAMKWSKMLTNLMANATSAILDMPPAAIFSHPGLYRIENLQLREALAVMDAQGLPVVDLPGTPVRLFSWAVRSLPVLISRPLISRAVGGGRGGKMPSLHIDLHSGRSKSEVDFLNGAVVRTGERLGIPTPINQALNTILLGLFRGKIPLETYQQKPDRLLHEIQNCLQD